MRLVKLIFLIVPVLYINAKQDFFYGFVNSDGKQISEKYKYEINDGYNAIKYIKKLIKQGRIDDAYALMTDLREKNKHKLLESDIIVTYSEILLKKKAKKFIVQGAALLEKSINASLIHEESLPKAYMILIDLKINSNRLKDAKYFAEVIINTYSDPVIKAYGKIYLAKVYSVQREFKKAEKILYKILTETSDLTVATIVADELYDIFILDRKRDRAYELIKKVLDKNIDYYADDSFMALKKINKLLDANMPEFAIKILQELLKRAEDDLSIEDFKFKLANVYMSVYDKEGENMQKAKTLYQEIINEYKNGVFNSKAKMFLDEILMREGKLDPTTVSEKYKESVSMQQKALMQEALNHKKAGEYEYILKAKKVYKKISDTISKRFGYNTIRDFFDEIHVLLVRDYLKKGQCTALDKALNDSRKETLLMLIDDKELKYNFFQCAVDVPNEKIYNQLKKFLAKTRDAKVYHYLEKIAYKLNLIDDAFMFSQRVDMVNDKKVSSEEFLDRFLVYIKKEDPIEMKKFFNYALKHDNYIEDNGNKPVILDFYYQFYLFLFTLENEKKRASNILYKLYNKQKEMKAYIYSPFVEMELAQIVSNEREYNQAIEYLLEALENSRKITPNDEVNIYYDLMKLYEKISYSDKYNEYLQKCKSVDGTTNSLYKQMCDRL